MKSLWDAKALPSKCFLTAWKAYDQADQLQILLNALSSSQHTALIALPYSFLRPLRELLNHSQLFVGLDNMLSPLKENFTAAISGRLLREADVSFVLLGTSQARTVFKESNEEINQKIIIAHREGITPLLCLGESSEEWQSGKSGVIIKEQLLEGLKDLTVEEMAKTIIVCEAPWIKNDPQRITLEHLNNIHLLYKETIEQCLGIELFKKLHIFYPYVDDIKMGIFFADGEEERSIYVDRCHTLINCLNVIPQHVVEKAPSIQVEERPAQTISENTLERSDRGDTSSSSSDLEVGSYANAVDSEREEDLLDGGDAEEEIGKNGDDVDRISSEGGGDSSQPSEETSFTREEARPLSDESDSLAPSLKIDAGKMAVKPFDADEQPQQFQADIPVESFAEDFDETNSEEMAGVSSEEELQERVSLMTSTDMQLKETYDAISHCGERMAELRQEFEGSIKKLEGELSKLDPQLQEQINSGNIGYFEEHPDKIDEARSALSLMQEIGFQMKESTSMPKTLEQIRKKAREQRSELMKQWEFFSKRRQEVQLRYPNFKLPELPSQLAIQEPVVNLSPPELPFGQSPLIGKQVGIVKLE